MKANVPAPDKDYKLIVRCPTYKHSEYICDALKGFAIQETNFPFICIVVDDASTDGNQEVIRRYANDNCDMSNAYVFDDDISVYMRVPHKTNTNCVYLFCFLKVNLYCKPEKAEIYKPYRAVCEYEASCEGDDYWIDPLKLQKQVDFLEANLDYSLCFHAAKIQRECKGLNALSFENIEDREYLAQELFDNWIAPTASFVFRTSIQSLQLKDSSRMLNGDIVLVLKCATIGKVRGFSDVMSVYRIQQGGVTYDPKLKKIRVLKYPKHYEFIYDNFKFLNKRKLRIRIADAYLNRMPYQDGFTDKCKSICKSFIWTPMSLLSRIKNKLF